MIIRTAIPIQSLCAPGFGACGEPHLNTEPSVVRVAFIYPTEENDRNRGEVVFRGVFAYRWTVEAAMTEYFEGAYSTVAHIPDSDWAHRVRKVIADNRPDPTVSDNEDMRHYVVYFDEHGCYELLAESFTIRHLETDET